MADPTHDPAMQPPARPRWVKVALIIGALAVLFIILSLLGVLPGGPGGHGPGRHTGSSGEMASSHSVDTEQLQVMVA